MLQAQHDTDIRVVGILVDVNPHACEVGDCQHMGREVDEVLEFVGCQFDGCFFLRWRLLDMSSVSAVHQSLPHTRAGCSPMLHA
jgi:hypothetical protein